VPIADLAKFVEDTIYMVERVSPLFPGRLSLTYERFCRDWEGTIRQVCDYLELPWYDQFRPVTLKQETRKLSEIIVNYEEVAEWCRNNGHEEWLEESR